MSEESRNHICPDCGREYEQEKSPLGTWQPPICRVCLHLRSEEAQAIARKTREQIRQKAWESICPPLYNATDRAKMPRALFATKADPTPRTLLDIVDGWQPWVKEVSADWHPFGLSLAFVGSAGTGKTRAMFELLRRLHFAGARVLAVSSVRMAKASADQFHDDRAKRQAASALLDEARRVPILFIDDLGKEKFTERAELELFDLLETRAASLRTTHWTANARGEELARKLSDDDREPILRRLWDFTEIFTAVAGCN